MARKNRSRRNGTQSQPQPPPPGGSARQVNPHSTPTRPIDMVYPRSVNLHIVPINERPPVLLATDDQRPNHNSPDQLSSPPPEALPSTDITVAGINDDENGENDDNDGFQVVTRRRRAVRTRLERRALTTPGRTYYSSTMDTGYSRVSFSRVDYLLARLGEAVEDDSLDFDSILREIDRILGTTLSSLSRRPVSPPVWAAEPEDEDSFDLGWGDDSETEYTAGRYETPTTLSVSVDNREEFPSLGGGGRGQAGSSSVRADLNQGQSRSQQTGGTSSWAGLLGSHPNRPVPRPAVPTNPAINNEPAPARTWGDLLRQPVAIPAVPVSTPVPGSTPAPHDQYRLSQPHSSPNEAAQPTQPPILSLPADPTSDHGWEETPESLDLKKIAEEASILLELYSKSNDHADQAESDHLIESAFKSVSTVRRHHRIAGSKHGRHSAAPEQRGDDLNIDAGCIICYSEVADTLLVPCNHLVLCATCCDMMGIRGKSPAWTKPIPCPICRAGIVDRIKVFRCS